MTKKHQNVKFNVLYISSWKVTARNASAMKCQILLQLKKSSTHLSSAEDCAKAMSILTGNGHL